MGSNPSTSDVVLGDPYDAPPSGITRRSFLAAVNALALVAVLEACTGKHHPAAATTSAGSARSSPTSFLSSPAASAATADFLAVLRQAVQASPDFLQQAAAKVVATKDVATISAFVRDRISVIPSWRQGDNPVYSKRWGARATLRGGAGSLRDRADLLVELLTAAGFTATVMSADLPSAIDLPTLYQVRAADFEPDQKLYAKAVALLPAGTVLPTASPTASGSAPAESPAQAAAKALAVAIPTALQSATIRKDLLPTSVPIVVVGTTSSGPSPSAASASSAQQYLFALGDLTPTTTAPSGLGGAAESPSPQVTVTVSAMTNPAPGSTTPHGQVVDLVSGTWLAEEVFGRQVILSFVPPSGAIGFLNDPANQSVRIPMLRIQSELAAYAAPPIAASTPPTSTTSFASTAPGASTDATQVFNGSPITLQGDVLSQPSGSSDDATVPVGAYGPMTALSASQLKSAIASATSMQATARATTFPEVELDVAVLDSAGNSVDGLDAAAFSITDNGTTAASIALMSNAASDNKPRILVIYDTTGSVAETWPSPAAKAAFEQSLATTLVAAAGQTPFDVQVLGLDTASSPDPTKWAAPDQAGLLAAFAKAGGEYSLVWGAVSGGGIDQGVVAILMVSDFQSNGELPTDIAAAQRKIGAAHIPVVCLTIGKPDTTAVSTLITLSGGTQLDPLAPATSSALAAFIKPLVAARLLRTYRMRYTAPTGGPATHMVTVSLTGRKTPVANAMYTAPATPATPWSFAGLYVRIGVAEYDSGVRHLAGVNLAGNNAIEALDDAAAVAETRAAIRGLTTIAIEPGSTTAAAILDDLIASAQSLHPVVTLPKTATAQDIVDAAEKDGVRRVPAVLASVLLPPVAQANPAAVPTMRVAILQERGNASGGVDVRMDLPPVMNTMEPLGSDPVTAFGAALQLSGTAAAAETTNFDASAFSSLAGRPLTLLPASTRGPWDTYINSLPTAQQPGWQAVLNTTYYAATLHALVPTGGTTAAFWVVDSTTGAATAVLLDGSGGALTNDASCTFQDDWLSIFIDLENALLTALALACIASSPTTAGTYYCVGKTADAVFLITNIIFGAFSGLTATGPLGFAAAVASVALAFAPFGSNISLPATEEAAAAAAGKQAAKVVATLGLGLLGFNYCDSPAQPAQPAGPTGGTSNETPPVCAPAGAEDGVCR